MEIFRSIVLTTTRLIGCIALLGLAPIASAQSTKFTNSHYGSDMGASNNAALSLLSPRGQVSFIGRHQWVGLDGAPQVYWGSAHLGFQKLGATAGLNLRQESIGIEKSTEASVFFAKSIRISSKDYIGMSLNAGLIHFNAPFSSLDGSDPSFQEDIIEKDALLGIGTVIYRPDVYYAGVSLPRLTFGGIGTFGDPHYNFENHIHAMGGYLFPIGADLHLRPSVLMSYSNSLGMDVEGSAMIFIKSLVGLGANVRSQGDLAGLLRLNLSGFGIAYSYQINPRNNVLDRRITNSTHEIGLSYNFSGIQRLL